MDRLEKDGVDMKVAGPCSENAFLLNYLDNDNMDTRRLGKRRRGEPRETGEERSTGIQDMEGRRGGVKRLSC